MDDLSRRRNDRWQSGQRSLGIETRTRFVLEIVDQRNAMGRRWPRKRDSSSGVYRRCILYRYDPAVGTTNDPSVRMST